MPHFVVDCSENILQQVAPEQLMQAIYDVAETSNLFAPGDIKVRLRPYAYFMLGGGKDAFVHIFGYIMDGRTTEQKAELAKRMIERLNTLLPDVPFLSIHVNDFQRATYCNKALIDPRNTTQDRHFGLVQPEAEGTR